MASLNAVLAGPLGSSLAILAMALATYLCRIGGVVIMSRVRLTPGVERALGALPGSIVAATVVPIAIRSGSAGIAGLVTSVVVTRLLGNEIAALAAGLVVAAGLAAAAGARALGL